MKVANGPESPCDLKTSQMKGVKHMKGEATERGEQSKERGEDHACLPALL